MEKYDILKSDEDKFLLLNFSNLFKPTDINYSVEQIINEELEKNVNPIIDVEYIRYKPSGVYNLTPNFLLNGTYSSSYVNASYSINEHLTSQAFRNSLFINEYYDGNDIQKNILISKNLIKIDEDNTYNIATNNEVSAELMFSNNIRNEFSYIYIPNYFLIQNINKIFLKLNFFNAKTGSNTSFTFNDEKINQSFFQEIDLNNDNYTWSMIDTSPKEYKNIYLDNKSKEDNIFNQIMGSDDKKDSIILSTGEIVSLKKKSNNDNIQYDLTGDIKPIEIKVDDYNDIPPIDKLSLGYQTKYSKKAFGQIIISSDEYITFTYSPTFTEIYRPYFYYDYIPYDNTLISTVLETKPKIKNYYFGNAIELSANTWNNISFKISDFNILQNTQKISFVNYKFGLMGKDSLVNIKLLPDKQYTNYYNSTPGLIARNIKINEAVIINKNIEEIVGLTDIADERKYIQTLPIDNKFEVDAPWINHNNLIFDEYKNKNLLIIETFSKSNNITINQKPNDPYYKKIGIINIDFTPTENGIYTPYTLTNKNVSYTTKAQNGQNVTVDGNLRKEFSIAPSKTIEAGVKTNFTFNIEFSDEYDDYVYFGIINHNTIVVLSENPLDPTDYNKIKRIQPVNEFMRYEDYINKETIQLKTEADVINIINRLENIREIHNPYAKIKFDGTKDSNF